MKTSFDGATDARQTKEWGDFLKNIGWKVEKVDDVYIFIRNIPFLHRSLIKIQHPKGPLPLKRIEAVAKKHDALFVVLEPHVVGYNEKILLQNDFQISKLRFAHSATRLIDLRISEAALLKSFSENTRRNIKKAQKYVDIKIVPLMDKNASFFIDQFYNLYKYLGKRKKFYVPSFHETNGKLQAFKETSVLLFAYTKQSVISKEERVRNPRTDEISHIGSPDLIGVRDDKKKRVLKKEIEPIAVLWVGSVGKTLVYFHPGNTERGYELLANYALIWEAMKWGKKQKLQFLDFETAYDARYPHENKNWKGYTQFKEKFGSELIEYPPSYIKFYNPLIKYLYLFGTMFSK